jgi:ParB/RepB/Spo0J family partition protein
MTTSTNNVSEYRDLPLNVLIESKTNPRRIFEDAALRELAESIRVQGVLSPLLVRPITDQSFEIIAGARRYRAAQIAEVRREGQEEACRKDGSQAGRLRPSRSLHTSAGFCLSPA